MDGGTEGLRAGIFDVLGTPLAYASTSYPTQFPAPSWAEQDPNDWWDALGKSVRKAISDSGISVDQIAAMAVEFRKHQIFLHGALLYPHPLPVNIFYSFNSYHLL